MPLDTTELREVFGCFATGVTVVTALDDIGQPIGLTINSFSSVSMEPPLVQWSLDERSRLLRHFTSGRPFAISILSAQQQDICMRFAGSKGAQFDGLEVNTGLDDVPLIKSASATIECALHDVVPAGDHHLILGRVRRADVHDRDPLLYCKGRFQSWADTRVPAKSLNTKTKTDRRTQHDHTKMPPR